MMNELLRVRSLMSAVKEASGVFDYGIFNITNPNNPTWTYWQISTTDNMIEIDISKVPFEPKTILAAYVDEKDYFIYNRVSLFRANEISNGYCCGDGGGLATDEKSLKEADAKYVKYDAENKKIFLHVNQWSTLKCGKWVWIALGELNDE